MDKEQQKTEKKLTQTDILERGWTKGMIAKFLPEPTLAHNTHCRQHPIKLWEVMKVEEIEKTEEFRDAIEKVKKRRNAGYKAASTKRKALEKVFEAAKQEINIPHIEDAVLREMVYQERRELNNTRGDESVPETADEDTMQRWIVNYMRHNFFNYDETLCTNKGKVGIYDCYSDYKKAILMNIAEIYPKYADECNRQMSEAKNRKWNEFI